MHVIRFCPQVTRISGGFPLKLLHLVTRIITRKDRGSMALRERGDLSYLKSTWGQLNILLGTFEVKCL